jgi:hypothetical protein
MRLYFIYHGKCVTGERLANYLLSKFGERVKYLVLGSRKDTRSGVLASSETLLRDRRHSTTACHACWAMGTKELKQRTVRKNIFCTVLLTEIWKKTSIYIISPIRFHFNRGKLIREHKCKNH